MCELLAMSARFPTTIQLSMTEVAAHDGVQLAGISSSDGALQDVALVASVPLSGEHWEPLPEGSVVALRGGRLAGIR